MFEFLVGAIVGGIIGVVLDRIWQSVEKRTRLSISGGHYSGLNDKGFENQGISLTVKNLGKEILPPIRLSIFHNKVGTYYPFLAVNSKSERDALWPEQERKFRYLLIPNQNHDFRTNPIQNEIAGLANFPSVIFQIQPLDSKKILFSNHRIGKAIARISAAQVERGGIGHIGSGVLGDLNYERMGPIRWLRRKLYIRSLLKEAAIAEEEGRQIPQS